MSLMTSLPYPCGDEPTPELQRLAAAAKRAATPCGSGQLVWRSWGAGPPLVLLHGGSGSWRHWLRTIPAFAPQRLVICPDLPGLGDSAMPDEPATPDHIAALLASGLATLLPAGQKYDLVGFSFGALCAGHLAALDRERCHSLILVGAGALGLPRGATPLVKVRHLAGRAREEAHRHNLATLMIADPARIDEVALAIQDLHSRLARFKSRGWAETDALKRVLERTCTPLGAIYGERDAIAYPQVAMRLDLIRRLRPQAQTVMIPGAGHWVAFEAAYAFNAALAAMLPALTRQL